MACVGEQRGTCVGGREREVGLTSLGKSREGREGRERFYRERDV